MPVIEVEAPRPLCPTGPATFRLKEVESRVMPTYSGDGEGTRLLWKFVSNRRTPDGDFYECPIWTGTKYGNAKAKLTWLLDLIDPGMTPEKAKKLNTDIYVGRDYDGSVKHSTSERDPNTKVAGFLYLRPVGAAAAPPDPFVDDNAGAVEGCEVCGQELTMAEINACQTRWPNQHLFCAQHGREKIALEKIEAAEAEDLFAAA